MALYCSLKGEMALYCSLKGEMALYLLNVDN
jgi:hypothetical protein